MAFRVVVLPAPLAPSKVVILPSSAVSETPLRTRITPSYTTSMLFSASKMPSLLRRLQCVLDDVAIGTEPVGLLDKFAAFDLENLYPAAAFVVGRGDLQRRHEATQGKIADLLKAVLDISPGRRLAAAGFQRITDALDMDRGLQ